MCIVLVVVIVTKDVLFKEQDATIIKRYCGSCIISLKVKEVK